MHLSDKMRLHCVLLTNEPVDATTRIGQKSIILTMNLRVDTNDHKKMLGADRNGEREREKYETNGTERKEESILENMCTIKPLTRSKCFQ